MFKSTSDSSLVLHQPEEVAQVTPEYYWNLYSKHMDIFLDYLKKYNRPEDSIADDIKYVLNYMELVLLMLIQTLIAKHFDTIFDATANIRVYVEIFFLRQAKIILNIPRDDDFTTRFSNQVYPLLEQIIHSRFPEAHAQLFVQPLNAQPIEMSIIYTNISNSIQGLINEISSRGIYTNVFNILLHAPRAALQLKMLVQDYLGTEEAYSATMRGIMASIKYRISLKEYLERKQEDNFEKAFAPLQSTLAALSLVLNSNAEGDLLKIDQALTQENLSPEVTMVLETEKYRLQSSSKSGFLSLV
ncbi:MAG: hypothetical protein K2Q14_02905 [Gammaproteobacteria bacterium]|nr:hypothetical protein [Gammaproteobacteria bacterium]